MPLSKPARRTLAHTREIRCQGFERDDGLWDIEGHITDVKSYAFDNTDRGHISAGEPIHDMWIRLTVDEDLVVHAAEAATDHSPYAVCPGAAAGYDALVGSSIAPGWRREVSKRTGGVKGCTHINDMVMGPMAVTAYQTIKAKTARNRAPQDPTTRPPLLDTCHAYRSDGATAKREFPDYFAAVTEDAPDGH